MGKHIEPPPPPNETRFPWRRVLFAAIIVAICGVGAAAAFVGTQSVFQKRSPVDVVTAYFVDPPQTYFHKDRISLLLLGIDYNYDDKDQEYSSTARSDTIMAVALNFPPGQKPSVSVLSVPRDTDAVMPDGHEDKINTAFALGGAKLSEKVVAKFLGVAGFDRFVTLRINATKDVVDAIGGIDVVPDETMNYDDNWGHLHIHFVGGKKYHMNGEQAVSYSRFRHDACSDPCRIKRQQQVVRIMIAKLKNDKFNDLLRVRQLVNVLNKNVVTDLTPAEEISLANAFKAIDLKDVASDQVPYLDDKELACCGDVLIADDAAKSKLVKKDFLDPVVPAIPTAPPDPALVAAIRPASITVEVENGSGSPGLGAQAAAALRAQGFTVSSVTNADSFAHDATVIHVHSLVQPLAGERVRLALLPAAVVTPDGLSGSTAAPQPDTDVTVIVGRDYVNHPALRAATPKKAAAPN